MAILFSAFCTIFQIQKYSYKNMLITIIVMALLVNFSFPIARVIIDISNVLMYSFVQGLGITSGTGGFTGQILTKSGLDTLVSGITSVANASPVFLIALVIFLFIFGMTLLIIAVLFVIRLVALAILIIFSPIAFVGPTLPFLSKYSGEWWDNLFKYCFFGPIMVFMLYVSLKMMTAISSMGGAMQTTAGQTGEAATTKLVGSIAFFSIPIVILWFGMAVAQKMSIAGAGALVDGASKFGKGAGKKLSGYNATKKRYDAYKDERKTRADEKFKKNWGKSLGQKVNNLQDKAQTILPKTKKDRFGSEAAQRRLDMRLKTVNKEAVKNAAEGKEGDGTIDLVSKISTTINMIPDDRAKLSKQDKISKAAEVKQAMSRGKEFEMEVQNRIKTRVAGSEMDKFVNDNKLTGAGKDEIKSAYYAAARKVIDEGEKAK
jgi:ABC-type multidrug transport system fused ATPase/permease subunit